VIRFDFKFYDVRLVLTCENAVLASLCENLRDDFSYFESAPHNDKAPEITLKILGRELDAADRPKGAVVFKTRLCDVYGLGRTRACDYGNGTWMKAAHVAKQKEIEIYGLNPERVYEAAYLAALSSVGEALDRLGYHRIHALAWEKRGVRGAYFASPGGGKSAAAMLLQKDPAVRIYSDEAPLIRGRTLYPFPVRVALRPDTARALGLKTSSARFFRRKMFPEKALFPIARSTVAAEGPVDVLFLEKRGRKNAPRVFETGCFERLRFLISFVMGLGLAQMAEHMVRSDNVWGLARIALSRLKTGVGLLNSSRTLGWVSSPDAYENSRALEEELDSEIGSENFTEDGEGDGEPQLLVGLSVQAYEQRESASQF
jgi:hypothetical protein